MALEFQRYSRDLLQTVSGDVSAKVEQAIKDSMHHYPALHPALDHDNPIRNESPKSHMDDGDSNTSSDPSHRKRGKGSPPPLLPHTSGTPPESEGIPRSPHEREREFQGLFTPSYLPLLDSRDNNRLPPAPILPTALPSPPSQIKELTRDSAKDEQTAPLPVVTNTTRPDPVRRPTEDTISSNTSDDSIGKQHRRSALRRSSSSSIKLQSPRRVRFEVEGGEVFPTASPPLSPRVTEHIQSPLVNTTNLRDSSYGPESARTVEETGLLGSSPPRPKKTSSTDRLKAMARSSDEDTSKWAMVGNLQDMDEDEEILVMGSRKPANPSSQTSSTKPYVNDHRITPQSNNGTAEHVEIVETKFEEAEAYEDPDDDMLEMPPLTSFKTRKRFSPPQSDISEHSYEASQNRHTKHKSAQKTSSKATPSSASVPRPTALDEDDELFDWDPDEADDDGLTVEKKGNKKAVQQKYLEDEDEEEIQDQDVTDDNAQEPEASSKLSTSPGIPIAHPAPASTSAPSRHTKEAVGSYNGRPFTISSVKDHSILEKAAQMGNFYSFVGSVDGRSGVDESTSYHPDTATFSGTPKSLSQRLMMEEFEESRRQ